MLLTFIVGHQHILAHLFRCIKPSE